VARQGDFLGLVGRKLDPVELEKLAIESWLANTPLTIGEPAQGSPAGASRTGRRPPLEGARWRRGTVRDSARTSRLGETFPRRPRHWESAAARSPTACGQARRESADRSAVISDLEAALRLQKLDAAPVLRAEAEAGD